MDYAKRLKLLFRVGDLDLPERRKRNTSSREEEDVDAHICPCGTTIECRTNIVGTCEIYKEERDALEMRNSDECDMDEYGRLESSEKTIAILGNRGWLQTAKQEGDRISKQFLRITWKKRNERPNVGGPYIRSKNGAPSRKGYVVKGQTTKASNMSTPPPPPPPFRTRRFALVQATSAWSVTTCRAPPRHSRDAKANGHTTTAMHNLSSHTLPHTKRPREDVEKFSLHKRAHTHRVYTKIIQKTRHKNARSAQEESSNRLHRQLKDE